MRMTCSGRSGIAPAVSLSHSKADCSSTCSTAGAAAAGDATGADRLFTEAVDHLDAHEAAHPRATLRVYRIVLAEDWVRSTLAAGGTPSAAAIYLLAESTRLLAANGTGASTLAS